MANEDTPKGLYALRHKAGGDLITEPKILTTGQIVFKGDLVKIVAGGTVEEADANDGPIVIGVAAEYKDGTDAGTKVNVYTDPDIIFGIQADTGTAVVVGDTGATANHVAGAGNADTKLSGHELDSSQAAASGGAQLKIINRIPRNNNQWGEHVELEVLINEHQYSAPVAGV